MPVDKAVDDDIENNIRLDTGAAVRLAVMNQGSDKSSPNVPWHW